MNGSDQFTLPALPTDSVVDSSSTAAQLGYRGADGGEEAAVGSGSPRGENPGKETAGEIREGSAGSSPGSSTGESGDGTATGSRNGEETALGGGNRSPTAGDPSKADSGDGGMVAEGPGSWRPGANGLELYDAEVPAAESCAPCNGEDLGTTAQGLEGGEAETDVPGLGAPPSGSPGTWGDGESLIARPPEPETETASPIGAADPADELGPYAATESEGSYPTDFEKYWKIVEDNPYDFTGWTYVLQYVEQENHLWAVRRAFDSFFTHYPYCYGYWKKYADIEKRFGFTKEAEEVYQRGLQSIPLSVDLWVHYITFLQEILDPSSPDMSAKLRSVFEMALAAAGTDFRSDRLWDSYVSWEKEQGQLKAVTAIYDRLLSIPTQLYSHHFEKFKEHVQSYSPKDILSTDEFLRLRSEVVSSLAAAEADSDDGPPGDDPPPGVGSTDQEKADTELEKIRAHLEATRHGMYLLNEEEVSKRWHFEEAIKRPYFHVKPLERVQLKNWKDYLDFEIASGTNERVLVLFERCVIACALYEDFWIKYAKYLENHSVEAVRNVFQRACMVHLPKKPTLHLLWAAFEEQQGDLQESRRILKTFQLVMPGLAMVLLRRVSLERRCGDLEQAEALLREAIEQHQGTPLASFFAIKLSRQLLKVQKNLTKARKVLQEAIDGDKDNVKLYLNLLELEFSCDVRANESNILGCFEQVLSSSLPLEIKIVFSQRRVEFLEDFGCSIRSLLHAYDDHQRFLKQNSSKKRAAENGVEEPEEKKARAEDSAAVIPAAATSPAALTSGDTSTSQAAYNYSAWYQPYGSYGYQSPWNYSQYYPHS